MFKFLKILILLIFLTTVYSLLTTAVYAKGYSITSADFKVQLNADGSADVVETRAYQFDGSFSWADEWINLKSKIKDHRASQQRSKPIGENYRIINFELWEGGAAVY